MIQQGIGYQESRQRRIKETGLLSSQIEAKGNEEFILYFGRAHIKDCSTGVIARGELKVGRGKFVTALQRGRNQPGVDFRIYAKIVVSCNEDTHIAERVVKDNFKDRNVIGSEGQRELYNIKDDELEDFVYRVEEIINDYTSVKIKRVDFY